ncbi:ATP-binding protein [Thiohalorhabdus sp. Cl-TMA]|uniref:histidine kinase n=1 Tax=Thiohalorhabdus methylotrophus TaxID=3242694 RepID=A0ABV4TXT8_9GAMM
MHATPNSEPAPETRLFEQLFWDGSLPRLVLDPQTRAVHYANPAARGFSGFNGADFREMPFPKLFPGSEGKVAAFLDRVEARQSDSLHLSRGDAQEGGGGTLQLRGMVLGLAGRTWLHVLVREISAAGSWEPGYQQWIGVGAWRLLQHIFHYSTEGFLLVDFESLEALEVNEALCRMLDRPRCELLGERPDSWLDLNDQGTFWREAERRGEKGSRLYEVRFVARDGRRVPVLANATTCYEGQGSPVASIVFITDLTRLKQSEEFADQLMQVLESFPGLIGMCDDHLEFLYHNRYAKDLLGADQSTNVTVRGTHPEWAFQVMREEALPAAAREGYWVGESALLDKVGREVPFLVTVVAHYDKLGGVGRFSIVGIDQSVQNLSEEKRRQYAEQLRSISRLISMEGLASLLAHQLNQPLASLTNYAAAGNQLIARECPESAHMRGLLENISEETRKASDIVVHVRKFLKGEGPDFRALDLNDLIRRLPPFLKDSTTTGQIPVRLRLAEDLPPVVGDWLQLQEVLHNLIHNAREANLESAPANPSPVFLNSRREGSQVVVEVVDEGPGLPDEMDTDALVRPFFTTKKGGIGLGLWVAYSILEGHGGRLEARRNASGEGATFRIRLPLQTE